MTLAIFDLDNTLIAGDSDHLWGEFACDQGLVDSADFSARNEQFYADYQAGSLDVDAYLRFALSTLRGRSPQELAPLHQSFMARYIAPIVLPKAIQLIDDHRRRGHQLVIITATNEFITRPIARALGIAEILATEIETVGGRYTGSPRGIPTYGQGKVLRLMQWLQGRDIRLDNAWFYSDSHNDLPLLEKIDNAVAVDPDDRLRAEANKQGWPIISLRD